MAFDIDLIKKVYSRMGSNVEKARALTGKPSGSPMLDALGGELSMPFNLNPGRTSGTID